MGRIWIAGVGLADGLTLTEEVKQAAQEAELLIGGKRLLALFPDQRHFVLDRNLSAATDYIASHAEKERICVLVSGDTGFYSYARYLLSRLPEGIAATVLPGISSMQAFCARLGISCENLASVSMHGRAGALLSTVSAQRRTFVLTGGQYRAEEVCRLLCESGAGGLAVWAGECLGGAQERIIQGTAEELSALSFADLTVLLVENPQAGSARVPDERALWAVSMLRPHREERCGCWADPRLAIHLAQQTEHDVLCPQAARETGTALGRAYGQYNLCYTDAEKAWDMLDAVIADEKYFTKLQALLRGRKELRYVLLVRERERAIQLAERLRRDKQPVRLCTFGELDRDGNEQSFYLLCRKEELA